MKVRKHIYFSGRVQGVGFRWQAHRICQSLALTGYVKNLWDGRVEMEVQGEEGMVTKMRSTLHQQPYLQIEDVEIADLPLKEEKGFRMMY